MANFEVLSLDPTTPQIRAPGAGDGYSVPRDMTFATGTTLNAPTTVVSVNTSTDALRITQVGSGNALVVEDSANPDATPTVINASGNVGIGTASPATNLSVIGTGITDASSNGAYQVTVDNNAAYNLTPQGGIIHRFKWSSAGTLTTGAGIRFYKPNTNDSDASSQIGFLVRSGIAAQSQAMTLDSSGNLGIGTASPTHRLTIGSGSYTQAAASSTTGMYTTATGLEMLSDSYYFGNRSGTNLAFLNSSGNLGLGVTPSAFSTGKAMQIGALNGITLFGFAGGAEFGSNFNFDSSYKYTTTGAAARYTTGGGSHAWYIAPSGTAGNAITFTQAMTLDASGNLLVGATSAVGRFTLQDTGTTTEITLRSSGGVGNNNRARIIGGYESGGSDYGGYLAFNTTSTSNVNGERVRITAAGNFGIGTSSPSRLFVARGAVSLSTTDPTVSATASAYADIHLRTWSGATNSPARITVVDNWMDFVSTFADGFRWFNYSSDGVLAERARITSGGQFLVGTSDASATSGAGNKLLANGQYYGVMAASTNSDTTLQVYSTGAGAYRFYVGLGGTVYATNTTISAISDQRYKENIRDLDVGLDAILALKPRKFDWKAGQGKDIKDDRGFIAQEFEQVFPDLVDEWKDSAPEGEEPYKSVRQDLIPVLVKAMQEQQAMIEELKAKVAALEAR